MFLSELSRIFVRCPVREHFAFLHTFVLIKTLFTWSGGPRSSGISFFCFVSPGAWKQKKLTPLDRGPPLHVNRPYKRCSILSPIGGFHAISGDTNNNGEINKFWWTNKES